MANPTPTYDEAVNAVLSELSGGGLTATILHFEDRRRDELETLREYQKRDGTYESELLFVDADVDGVEGKSTGEVYAIYKFELRHIYTVQDEEQISRTAKFRAEKIRLLIEGNEDIFRIDGQVPLRTPESASLRGRFVTREDSKYYESTISFEVEARRWE